MGKFRTTFVGNTHHNSTWDTFGLTGHSGSMYIDNLINNIDRAKLDMQLKVVLRASPSEQDAKRLMNSFYAFLENTIRVSPDPKIRRKLQPGRTPAFISIWWHMQDREHWPIFYRYTREALEKEELYKDKTSPTTDDYFTFRRVCLELQAGLGWSPWELEHVCDWMTRGQKVI